jgi:two-component system, sensor histidine kinase PdtaS
MIKHAVISFSLLFFLQFNACAQQLSKEEINQALSALRKSNADTVRVNLLIKVSEQYIWKPGESAKDLDTAILLASQAELLSKKLSYYSGYCNSFLLYSMAYREKGEREKGKQYINQAINLSESHKQYLVLGDSYLELSQYHNYWEPAEVPVKIEITKKSYNAFIAADNIERQAFALKNLADLYRENSNLALAITELLHALSLYKSIGYLKLQGVYDLLGNCYSGLSDFSNAIKYGLLALESARLVKDSSLQLVTIHNRLGVTYFYSQKFDLAIPHFFEAFRLAQNFNDRSQYTVAASIVNSYIKLKKPTEALAFLLTRLDKDADMVNEDKIMVNTMFLLVYTSKKDYAAAKINCDWLLNNVADKKTLSITTLAGMTGYFTATKQFSKAEEYLGYFKQAMIRDTRSNIMLLNRLMWFRLDSARGNYLSAIRYLSEYNLIQDSLYNINKSKIIEATQIEYETAKKDQDIQLKAQSIQLLQKQSLLQQNNLQRSQQFLYTILIGLILVLAILLLLYHQYRLKNRVNQQINEKNEKLEHLLNEKEWLLKEVHHRVKNNLQTVVSLLESQSAYLDSDALLAIQDSQNRVHVMSLIHQKLYQAENVSSIGMEAYVPELVNYLRESYNAKNIQFNLQISPLELDVSQAIPIGLIINEAVTNSIKYAFNTQAVDSNITISMYLDRGNEIALTISDNGKGLPADFKINNSGGLGLKLMKGLTEDIHGRFSISDESGTAITIIFIANTPFLKLKQSA